MAATNAKVDYFVGGKKKSIAISSIITVNENPLKITLNATRNLELGENTTLYYNISSSKNLTLNSMRLTLPDGLRLISSSGVDKLSGNTFKLYGDFSEGESMAFEINVRAEESGNHSIKTDIESFVENFIQEYTLTETLNVTIEKPKISLSVKEFNAGNNTISIIINNPTKYDFNNIKLQVSGLVEQTKLFYNIERFGHKTLTIPFYAEAGNHSVTLTMTYQSTYGEEFEEVITENITVTGVIKRAVDEEAKEIPPEVLAEDVSQQKKSKQIPSNLLLYSIIAAVLATLLIAVIMVIKHKKKGKTQPVLYQS
jgi:hypothetical protein